MTGADAPGAGDAAVTLGKWYRMIRLSFEDLPDDVPDAVIDAVGAVGKAVCVAGSGHRWELDHCGAIDHAYCADCQKPVESREEAHQAWAQIQWHRRFPNPAGRNAYFDELDAMDRRGGG